MFVLRLLLLPDRGGKKWALSSSCKTDWADFTDLMSLLPSDLMEDMSANPEGHSANT